MRYARSFLLGLLVLAVALAATDGAAKNKSAYHVKDYPSYQVQTIGIMAWGMRKNDDKAGKIMRRALEQALAPLDYNYKSESGLRSLARGAGAESLLTVLEEQWRADLEMDPATVKAFGARVSVDALLASFIDVWERNVIEYNERGNSLTEIGVRHALYSTKTGELLWSAAIEQEGEGPYNDPSGQQNVAGVNRSGIQTQVRTTTALDPPKYEEVARQVGKELTKEFPPPPEIKQEKAEPEAEPDEEKSDDSG